ncbi:hypothetical protein TK90_0258 [Thioalkalivibrio sp. K90mix]|nr:hypothetical protein TK90_0258 [Thioalkalivibrio sp. K90mix]
MRVLVLAAIAALMSVPALAAPAPMTAVVIDASSTVNHGGGCRKSSPPGQCCHRDNSTGTVHCH